MGVLEKRYAIGCLSSSKSRFPTSLSRVHETSLHRTTCSDRSCCLICPRLGSLTSSVHSAGSWTCIDSPQLRPLVEAVGSYQALAYLCCGRCRRPIWV